MAKVKTKYICQQCGYESAKWWGICPECNSGGSMVEEAYTQKETARAKKQSSHLQKSVDLKSVEGTEADRFTTHISEFDRVLGGGIVRGSLVLIGGDPGIGKSTLLLQLAHHISKEKKVLYISGEESAQQIKLRASRLFSGDMNMLILAETNLDTIEGEILAVMPDVVVIDSVQTVSSPELTSLPGSVSQVREATGRLMNIAKANNISCFLVGHVQKKELLQDLEC